MKIKEFIKKYNKTNDYILNLEVSKTNRIKSLCFGYLIALLIVMTPIIISAHFFIYSFYHNLVIAVIALFVLIFICLGEYINHKLLIHFSKKEDIPSLKPIYIVDFTLYLIMCIALYLIILLLF